MNQKKNAACKAQNTFHFWKMFSFAEQQGEINCLERNNSGDSWAAELFCRLEGWTVQTPPPLPPHPIPPSNALSIDLSRNYSSAQKPTQSVHSAPRHPPLQKVHIYS